MKLFTLSRYCRIVGLIALLVLPAYARADALRAYETPYYTIHTELEADDAKETIIRMSRMFEEYRRRTQGFSGQISRRFDFYLYRREADYLNAGGLPNSVGVFTGETLMAVAGEHITDRTWHIVQHEGFHQFAHAVIRGELPTWLNEGLAEYFGEAVFTGDSFVSGVIPPDRLRRLKREMTTRQLKSVDQMMRMSRAEWNKDLAYTNYDQAWSMVHFLVHGDDGKYQQALVRFIVLLGQEVKWQSAWQQTFGDSAGLEQRWREWWSKQPADPTADLFTQAHAQTFASYVARAAMQRQRFDDFDSFLHAAVGQQVRTGQTIDDWLPPRLLEEAAEREARSRVKWLLQRQASNRGRITANCTDGVSITVTYQVRLGEAPKISCDIDDTSLAVERARNLIESGDHKEARKILQQALMTHPRSPAAAQARELLRQTQ